MNLTQKSYQRIRQSILEGETAFDGRLSINMLSKKLGIGRSPVRDAVNRLAAEGLLRPVAKSGVVIRNPALKDLREIVELREALEPCAAAMACERIKAAQSAGMRKCMRSMRAAARRVRDGKFRDDKANRGMQKADREFHSLLLKAAGNARLRKIVEDHQLLLHKVRYPSTRTTHHLAMTLLEHWRIYRAVEYKDAAAAAEWMRRHTRRGARAALSSWHEVYAGPQHRPT